MLFYRWHITNEGFPCFNTNMDWFNLKIVKRVDYNKPLTYTAHYAATIRAFDACSVSISKKTHMGRSSGAQHAEIDGATEGQLRRHGRWNMQSMESCYLTSLPRSSIRVINGFSGNKGDYWLPRSNVCPPESLQRKVFLQEDEWRYHSCEYSICAEAFLSLLITMRRIILQDAVMFRVENLENSLFNNVLFSDLEFLAFEVNLLSTVQAAQEPADIQVRRALPLVGDHLQMLSAKMDANQRIQPSLISNNSHSPTDATVGIKDDIFGLRQDMQMLRQTCSLFTNGT
ncbi:unnamed protein product [Rhizopus microsporus]